MYVHGVSNKEREEKNMKNEQSVKRMSRLKCFSVANFFGKVQRINFPTHPPPLS